MFGLTFFKVVDLYPACRAEEVHWVGAGPPPPPLCPAAPRVGGGGEGGGEEGKSLCPSTPPLSLLGPVSHDANSKPKLRKNEKPTQKSSTIW